MRTKPLLLLILVMTGALCPETICLGGQTDLAAADNDFGFRLLKEIAQARPEKNIFISPYSAATVLQMVANGAAGRTSSQMREALGTTNLSDAEVNAANQQIGESLNQRRTKVTLTTANAIWYRKGITVQPTFLKCNREYFDATVAPLEFSDPRAVGTINDWASKKTHGKIKHLADGLIDPQLTRLLLANAVYFHGKWNDQFNSQDTKLRPFFEDDGSQKPIPMMTKTGKLPYRRGTGYQAVRLAYEDQNIAMYLFLPDTSSNPRALQSILDDPVWQLVNQADFSAQEGTLVLPKFKLEDSVPLNQSLKALGMKTAFDRDGADFSGIGPNLYISAVLQKTLVEVKEEGTEAAAATAISITALAGMRPPPHPFNMVVDHPFLFVIKDDRSGIILFIGLIYDPPTTSE